MVGRRLDQNLGARKLLNLYNSYVLPRVIACACGYPALNKYRQDIVSQAYGEVLELGIGAGGNLNFYDASKVSAVHAVEPCPTLRSKALKAPNPNKLNLEIVLGAGEQLPYPDRKFDCVVCTFTLCSVSDVAQVLSQARRVLKPGGAFLFCEHGLAPDAPVARWQRRLDPVWRHIAGGCRLTREAFGSLRRNGFEVDEQGAGYADGAPRFVGWMEWGRARAGA